MGERIVYQEAERPGRELVLQRGDLDQLSTAEAEKLDFRFMANLVWECLLRLQNSSKTPIMSGRGRSRTYRGRLAPSNGFEARASHRTRCSSEIDIAGSSRSIKGRNARLFWSGEYFAAAQHDARVADPSGHSHLIEAFEDLDCHIAADAATFLHGRRSDCALGRAVGELARDFREARQGFGQKEPVVGDPCNPAQPLSAAEKALHRLGL